MSRIYVSTADCMPSRPHFKYKGSKHRLRNGDYIKIELMQFPAEGVGTVIPKCTKGSQYSIDWKCNLFDQRNLGLVIFVHCTGVWRRTKLLHKIPLCFTLGMCHAARFSFFSFFSKFFWVEFTTFIPVDKSFACIIINCMLCILAVFLHVFDVNLSIVNLFIMINSDRLLADCTVVHFVASGWRFHQPWIDFLSCWL